MKRKQQWKRGLLKYTVVLVAVCVWSFVIELWSGGSSQPSVLEQERTELEHSVLMTSDNAS